MSGRCSGCGSTIPKHHTPLCDVGPREHSRDLPGVDFTAQWTGFVPHSVRRETRKQNVKQQRATSREQSRSRE